MASIGTERSCWCFSRRAFIPNVCHGSVEPPFESRIALHLRVIGCRIQAMATGGTSVSLSRSSAWCRRFSSSHANAALVVILAIVALGLSTEARVASNSLSNYNYNTDEFYGSLQSGDNSGQQLAIATSLRGSPGAGWSNFVKTFGHQFVLNGRPLYVNGANVYWLMTYGSDSSTRWIVDDIFQQAAGAGITVIRTWAFSDGVQYKPLQIIPGVYDEQVFQVKSFLNVDEYRHLSCFVGLICLTTSKISKRLCSMWLLWWCYKHPVQIVSYLISCKDWYF